MKIYHAKIKWLNEEEIEDVIMKIGEVDEKDDDNIFFYLENEDEIELFKEDGYGEWTILEIEEVTNGEQR